MGLGTRPGYLDGMNHADWCCVTTLCRDDGGVEAGDHVSQGPPHAAPGQQQDHQARDRQEPAGQGKNATPYNINSPGIRSTDAVVPCDQAAVQQRIRDERAKTSGAVRACPELSPRSCSIGYKCGISLGPHSDGVWLPQGDAEELEALETAVAQKEVRKHLLTQGGSSIMR